MIKTVTHDSVPVFCDCHDLGHVARLDYFPPVDGDPGDAYLTFHLRTWRGFWSRLRRAFKYAFGGRSPLSGEWDEICLKRSDARQMIELLERFVSDGGEQ